MSIILPRMIDKRTGAEIASRRGAIAELMTFLGKLDPTRPWEVLVRPWKKARSSQQNRALFGLAYPIIREATGHSVDELHTAFCRRFFGTVEVEIMGQAMLRPRRTTTRDEHGKRDVLDWKTFSDFYAEVEDTAASSGIKIPPPDPNWRFTPCDPSSPS